jgi:hypothetical protein
MTFNSLYKIFPAVHIFKKFDFIGNYQRRELHGV